MFNDGGVIGSCGEPESPSWAACLLRSGLAPPQDGCSCRLPSPQRKGTSRAVVNPQATSTNREPRGLQRSLRAACCSFGSVEEAARLCRMSVIQVIR